MSGPHLKTHFKFPFLTNCTSLSWTKPLSGQFQKPIQCIHRVGPYCPSPPNNAGCCLPSSASPWHGVVQALLSFLYFALTHGTVPAFCSLTVTLKDCTSRAHRTLSPTPSSPPCSSLLPLLPAVRLHPPPPPSLGPCGCSHCFPAPRPSQHSRTGSLVFSVPEKT